MLSSCSTCSTSSPARAFPTERREEDEDEEGKRRLLGCGCCSESRLHTTVEEGVAGDGDVDEDEVLLRDVEGSSVLTMVLLEPELLVVASVDSVWGEDSSSLWEGHSKWTQ